MIIFALTLWILNQRALNRIVRYRNSRFQKRYILTYSLMILSAVIMGIVVNVLNNILQNSILPTSNYFALIMRLIICVFISLFVYCFLIITLGVVRKRDADYIPFISRFEFLLRG